MYFHDALSLGTPVRTKDGYLAVRARAARAGVYQYLGAEVDPSGSRFKASDVVNVYRPEAEVFDKASVGSFFAKPITDNHPREAVTSTNWRDHARGVNMGAMRDGEYLAFDLVLMDSNLVADVDGGKRELSNGYACDLAFEDGTAPDGTPYQAVQRNIRGNHIAVVDRGRAGSECRIASDKFASCDANPAAVAAISTQETTMKIRIGDAEVDATNGEAVRIAVDGLNSKFKALETQVGSLTADLTTASTSVQTKDGEIAALKQQLADATDPAKVAARDAARAAVVDAAKALVPAIVTDGKSDADIRKEAVIAKLGDSFKDAADAMIEGAFAALTKDATPADPLRKALGDGVRTPVNDAAVVSTLRHARYA